MNPEKANSASWRVVVYLVAVVCFFVQAGFVYLDYPRGALGARLSAQAKGGLALWRKNNCQACHQIYGYGGFLGPDLTNVMSRRPLEDWTDVLTRGRKQMPAFHFDQQQRAAIIAFLTEMNDTGTSIPHFAKLREDAEFDFLVSNYLRGTKGTADEAVLRGERQIRENGCNKCHWAFGVGIQGSPDLTLALSHRSPEYVRTILRDSKEAMPSYEFLTDDQVGDILACMAWMNLNRRELGLFSSDKENGDTFHWSALPWFEY